MEMKEALHVALLGYGTVGKGVYETIKQHQGRLQKLLGKEVKVVAVLVKNISKHKLSDRSVILTDQYKDIINLQKLDVVIDAIVGIEPAYSFLQQAINRGCHVITANKEMFAHHSKDLHALAKEKGVTVGFEATVAGGIPIIQTLKRLLNANKVQKIEGILNGTSNFILTKMREEKLLFTDALSLAQDLGYAEADPTNDIDGHDAFFKAVILSEVLFGEQPDWGKAVRVGISTIKSEDIAYFQSLGLRFKHVASLQQTNKGVVCTVRPVLVSEAHPLYQVEDVQNAINIEADIVGNISLQGPGAGMFPTASAIIEDIIHIDDKEYVPCFEEESSNSESAEQLWIAYGENALLGLPENAEVIKKIADYTWLVKGDSNDNAKFDIRYYQLLGSADSVKAVEKVH